MILVFDCIFDVSENYNNQKLKIDEKSCIYLGKNQHSPILNHE